MPTTRHQARPRPHTHHHAKALTEHLDELALRVEAAFGEQVGWGGMNQLVFVRELTDHSGADVGLRPIDGDFGDGIIGLVAPAEWDAVGAATLGWERPLAEDGSVGERRCRVRCVYLQQRDGPSAAVVRRLGDEACVMPGPTEGRIPDLLRRVLQLPTPPPARPPTELIAGVWLERLLALPPELLRTWRSVAACHPLIDEVHPARVAAAEELGAWMADAARGVTWESTRLRAAAGDGMGNLSAADAAWLDEGSFARELLGHLTPLSDLIEAVSTLVPASVGRRLRATLRAWGLDVRGPQS